MKTFWIFLLLPFSLFGQWTSFEIDGIDKIYDVYEHGDSTFICAKGAFLFGNKSNGLVKKIDFPDGLPLSVLSVKGRIWVGAGSGLYTIDDRSNWQRASPSELRFVGALASTAEGVILAAPFAKGSFSASLPAKGSVFVSRNNGQSWSNQLYELQNPEDCFGIEVVGEIAYLYSASGIYQSNSAISNWTKLALPLGAIKCLAAGFSPDKQYLNLVAETVFGSVRFYARPIAVGEWTELPNPPTALSFPAMAVYSDFSGYQMGFAAVSQGAFAVSVAWQGNQFQGATWRKIFDSAPPFSHKEGWLTGDSKVEFIKSPQKDRLYCASRTALYQTQTNGVAFPDSWIKMQTPTLAAARGFVQNQDTLWLVGQGLALSTDLGKTWSPSLPVEIEVHQVSKTPFGIFAATSIGLLRWQSARWQSFQRGQPAARVWQVQSFGAGLLIAVENQGIFWIKDVQTTSATNIATGSSISVNNVNAIGVLGDTLIVNLATGTQQGLYRGTQSQGNWTWERIFGISVRALATSEFEGKNVLLVAANWSAGTPLTPSGGDLFNSQVLISTNAGRNWNFVLAKADWQSLAKDFQPSNSHSILGLAVLENRIYTSVFDVLRDKTVAVIETIRDFEFGKNYHFDFTGNLKENYAQQLRIDKINGSETLFYSPSNGAPSFRVIRNTIPTSLEKDVEPKVYPNPFQDHVRIDAPVASVELFDIEGRYLTKFESNLLDLQSFKSGFYILKIQTHDGDIFYQRICKP